MQVLDELVDEQRTLIVAECDCVARKAGLESQLGISWL
jgi:hypothetical protein